MANTYIPDEIISKTMERLWGHNTESVVIKKSEFEEKCYARYENGATRCSATCKAMQIACSCYERKTNSDECLWIGHGDFCQCLNVQTTKED